MSAEMRARASAVCAAKSAGWASLRRSNAGEEPRAAAHAQMLEADAAAEEFRVDFFPAARKAFGIGDRAIGQAFEMFVITADGDAMRVWRERV